MLRFFTRRLLLALFTLGVLLVVVTLIPNIAPGDPARKIAGGTASPERLMQVTESLGLDKPITTQLLDLAKSVVSFDFGEAYTRPGESVIGLVGKSLWNSAKLVGLGLAVTLPLSVLGGIWAAYRRGTWVDTALVSGGVALAAIPEFVSGVVLLMLLGIPFSFFKVIAVAPHGSSVLVQIQHMILPVLAILVVYFGYIARIVRAGAVKTLESPFIRTVQMKGLAPHKILFKHVLKNSLAPAVAVVGTQLGYLFGGMVGLELVFNYPGLGRLILDAVRSADYPVLRAGVVTVGIIYMLATLIADSVVAWMNPRSRLVENLGG